MSIIDLIDSDLNEQFNETLVLNNYTHKQAIEIAKHNVIEMYGLKQPYDNKTIEHLNAVALAY